MLLNVPLIGFMSGGLMGCAVGAVVGGGGSRTKERRNHNRNRRDLSESFSKK